MSWGAVRWTSLVFELWAGGGSLGCTGRGFELIGAAEGDAELTAGAIWLSRLPNCVYRFAAEKFEPPMTRAASKSC